MTSQAATLLVKSYGVSSTGEEWEEADDPTDFHATVALLRRKREEEQNDETWTLFAEIDV
jgi:hypothetical protein